AVDPDTPLEDEERRILDLMAVRSLPRSRVPAPLSDDGVEPPLRRICVDQAVISATDSERETEPARAIPTQRKADASSDRRGILLGSSVNTLPGTNPHGRCRNRNPLRPGPF